LFSSCYNIRLLRMHIVILHNQDAASLDDDPGLAAREDVERVAGAMASALQLIPGCLVETIAVDDSGLFVHGALSSKKPDVVFNLCESVLGDARGEMLIPAMLDALKIPYSGSTALALGIALHKDTSKALLEAANVPTPRWMLADTLDALEKMSLQFPVIVKPSREDASVGIDFGSVVYARDALDAVVSQVIDAFGQPALIEEFIDGHEVYVPILGNAERRALPLSQIQFGESFAHRPKILSYKAKWDVDSVEFAQTPSVPAVLEAKLQQRCIEVAMAAFEALGCRDYGRVDLRIDAAGQPFVIEVNPNCDLHPQAGFAKAAATGGIGYSQLARCLIELALERRHGNQSDYPRRQEAPLGIAEPNRNLHRGRSRVRARAHRRRSAAQQS
jgi:D-alanine-D-alanine ligase